MIFTREQVFDACERVAPSFNFEVELVQALCLQEGGRKKDGCFAPDRARLENGFYSRYTEKQNLPTTTEILLAASYGVTQMMGESLRLAGYFEDYFNCQTQAVQQLLGSPLSQIAVVKAIDDYCENLMDQITYGCKWLSKKREMAGPNIVKMLGFWNGDLSGKYADEVLGKYHSIKGK
jgi:hypothetical protein